MKIVGMSMVLFVDGTTSIDVDTKFSDFDTIDWYEATVFGTRAGIVFFLNTQKVKWNGLLLFFTNVAEKKKGQSKRERFYFCKRKGGETIFTKKNFSQSILFSVYRVL